MKRNLLMAAMLVAGAAFAGGATLPEQASDRAVAAQANRDSHPTPPEDRPVAPTLPEQASDRARQVLSEIAFGQKGAESRAEHAAQDRAATRAAEARAAAVSRGAEARAAAAARAAEARGTAGAARATVPAPAGRSGR